MGPRESNFGTVAGLHGTVTWRVHETVTWKVHETVRWREGGEVANEVASGGAPRKERTHRVSVRPNARLRPIVTRFFRYRDRETEMNNSQKLKGTNIFVNEDICSASQAAKNAQILLLKQELKGR
ncbi:hypothetical protein E2C01_085554 [Portunus trituberculatus]|uniref:Uncharacterized protein n=1 Tax=Portunus trituberculatus TaxID=210409 RepID=A0A5B7IYE5_PORTR|nr:hypothetical protein [Portunus trituberculatus]